MAAAIFYVSPGKYRPDTNLGPVSLCQWDQGVGPGISDKNVPVTLPESLKSYNFVKDTDGYPSEH
jgi:hypothetical protein